jgi:circadian clock protein KaiB
MQKKKDPVHEPVEAHPDGNVFILKLFITGATPNSIRAVGNIKKICEDHLKGRYRLEIIDVYQQMHVAEKEQLLALPLLVRKAPLPEKRLIGDLSNTEKVLHGLGVTQ